VLAVQVVVVQAVEAQIRLQQGLQILAVVVVGQELQVTVILKLQETVVLVL
jgi:hypothetical protein